MSIVTELNKKYDETKQIETDLHIIYDIKRKAIEASYKEARGTSIIIDSNKHKFTDDVPKNNRWLSLSWNAMEKHFSIDTGSGRISIKPEDFPLLIEAYNRFIQE